MTTILHNTLRKSFIGMTYLTALLGSKWLESHEGTQNIGFVTRQPVPFRDACLIPQEVFDDTTVIYSGVAVEPTLAVNPNHHHHIVAAWQQGYIDNGGALECGIAFSKDGGKKWRKTLVPFQKCIGGIIQRISDVRLSYAKDGSHIYLIALLQNVNNDPSVSSQSGVAVSISYDDGEHWTGPKVIYSSNYYLNDIIDSYPISKKTSISSDRNNPFYAYSVWDNIDNLGSLHSASYISRTKTGGSTWSTPTVLYDPYLDPSLKSVSNNIQNDYQSFGNVIIVLPKATPDDKRWQDDSWGSEENKAKRFSGNILNFMGRVYATPQAQNNDFILDSWPYTYRVFDTAVTRSNDHGKTWSQTATKINSLGTHDPLVFTRGYSYLNGEISGKASQGNLLRTADTLLSCTVNPVNGFLYVVYQTGQFRSDGLPAIALQVSRDGGYTWSRPVIVSRTPATSPNPQAFTPSVAINKEGRIGILYYDTRNDPLDYVANTPTDAWLAVYKEVRSSKGGSTGIGLDFVKEVRLTKESFNAQNGPMTSQGIKSVGDYITLDAQGNNFYAVFTATTNGPFNGPVVILTDNDNIATLELDENLRQFPYFIKIDDN